MNTNVLRVLLLCLVFVSCKKDMNEHSENLKDSKQVSAATTSSSGATSTTSTEAFATLYSDISYWASTRTIFTSVTTLWDLYTPSDDELTHYSLRFTISGHQPYPESAQIPYSSSASYSTNISPNYSSTITITVKIELLYYSDVKATASQSLTIHPDIDASNEPRDSTAVITLNQSSPGNNYTLQASNMAYLEGDPSKSLYLYAFYIPTLDERNNLGRKSLFLGYTKISGSDFFPATGGFGFELPYVSPSSPPYSASNIRVVLSKKLYNTSYFTDPLKNVGYETYLIDNCVDDAVLYDVYCRGLNSTNGIFSNYSYPSSMNFAIGSMDRILDYQIYVFTQRGFL